MPELDTKTDLAQMLRYEEPSQADAFVMNVMQGVQRAQQIRQLVLVMFGLIGAVFGVLGAFMLSDSITRIFSDLPAMGTMQVVLAITAVGAFYTWFMNDELGLAS